MTPRTSAALILALAAGDAPADDLYSNGGASPSVPALGAAPVSLSGEPVPGGGAWSEAPASGAYCNSVAGFSTHAAGPDQFRFADDFTVPPGGWTLSSASLYAYVPGEVGPVSPFTGINVRIWAGRPDEPGSVVVFGDDVTNRLVSSRSTSTYRIFNTVTPPLPTAPVATRLLWENTAGLGVFLGEGDYWIDWQYSTANPDAAAYSPAATAPGSRGTGNAVQQREPAGIFDGGWVAIVDEGKPAEAADLPQDLPFILRGSAGVPCDPDINCDGVPDQGDVACMILAVAGDLSCFCQTDPDFNRDGVPDQGDVADVILTVAGAPCP